ncbi:MAG: AI-2E family transporter [Leptolyngbya sp. DLM2.Bin27]|nr:MAG: AI-2E family transporter [Leptolyngbya sp. DLM2.Bin27]
MSLVILGVCLYIVWLIRNVLLLTLAAIVLAVVLNQFVRSLQKHVASRRLAVFFFTLATLLVLTLAGVIVVPVVVGQMQDLINLVPLIIRQIEVWIVVFSSWVPGLSAEGLADIENIFNQLQTINIRLVIDQFFMVFSNTLTVAFNGLLIGVLTIMMLLNPAAYRRVLIKLFPTSMRPQVDHILDNCEQAITGWFIGISFNMSVIALMSLIGLWLLGIPFALANGLLAGLLAFIPYLGPVISVVPPVAIALLDTPWKALAVVVLYIAIQQVETNVLTPQVMQKQVSLLPAVMLLAQVIFTAFFGFLGLLLALPLTLIVQQWLKEFWFAEALELP